MFAQPRSDIFFSLAHSSEHSMQKTFSPSDYSRSGFEPQIVECLWSGEESWVRRCRRGLASLHHPPVRVWRGRRLWRGLVWICDAGDTVRRGCGCSLHCCLRRCQKCSRYRSSERLLPIPFRRRPKQLHPTNVMARWKLCFTTHRWWMRLCNKASNNERGHTCRTFSFLLLQARQTSPPFTKHVDGRCRRHRGHRGSCLHRLHILDDDLQPQLMQSRRALSPRMSYTQ